MLDALRRASSPVAERQVVADLLSGHSRPAVRRAVRAGVASGLSVRQTGFARAAGRLVRVLTSDPSADWGGEDAHLTRSAWPVWTPDR